MADEFDFMKTRKPQRLLSEFVNFRVNRQKLKGAKFQIETSRLNCKLQLFSKI